MLNSWCEWKDKSTKGTEDVETERNKEAGYAGSEIQSLFAQQLKHT